jgi:hypothetical protein
MLAHLIGLSSSGSFSLKMIGVSNPVHQEHSDGLPVTVVGYLGRSAGSREPRSSSNPEINLLTRRSAQLRRLRAA